ncbi:glycoside hydrolase family 76 protein [Suhomyces tanzawaensis NRRL Y-17324]|uniref:Glycoside hydrolase family 76 protein n=1 Tax=Suhomyces tanzawaensis NRRL Y-17324 TaxID=984487 RepID=A0A1E4SJK9_9ASCO|nr:glycoside hydrolase family 76 protein [Suhomyces tanzawaensis NRRL Y-17324]ODV79693.1 glycoside hydrolase family 76 protein [Suhomyces tanzawaensis NRRL Y-17324]
MQFWALLATVSLASAVPTKVDKRDTLGNYTTSIKAVQTPIPTVSTSEIFDELSLNLWSTFWDTSHNDWVDVCGATNKSHLWSVAVAGRAIALGGDDSKTQKAVDIFSEYKSASVAGYSATQAKDTDIYTDDDAQVVWALVDAYNVLGDKTILDEAIALHEFIENQKNPQIGGITWNYQGKYVALISVVEAALSALKIYEVKQNRKLIDFAKYCLGWTFDNLLDPENKFINDGKSTDGSVNQGKLTYTVGVAMSSLAYLLKWDQSEDWLAKAVELGVRSLGGGNLDSQFFTDGYINDTPDHSVYFYAGLADILELTSPLGGYQNDAYGLFKNELVRETRHLYDQYSSVLNGCQKKGGFNSLLNYGSLTQIFYQVNRVAPRI